MKSEIYITEDAELDIIDIYDYIFLSDSSDSAEYVFDNIKKTCMSLADLPNRGHCPPELERIGILEYKEVHFKPYRIIYQIVSSKVYIHCVLDGRRDLQEILLKRLLR